MSGPGGHSPGGQPGHGMGAGHGAGAGPGAGRHDGTGPGTAAWVVRAATAVLGAAMIAVPAVSVRGPGQFLAAAGLLLVAATLAGPLARWTATGTIAGVAAVLLSVFAHPGTAGLAAEGLLVLGYLLLLDAPRRATRPSLARWLRLQVPAAAAGVAAAAVVVIVLAVTVPSSLWLVLAGTAAAVGATVIALPRRRPGP